MIAAARNFGIIFHMQCRQAFFHKKAAVATILSWGLRVALTIILYQGIYKILGQSKVNALDYKVAISSMMFYAIFSGFAARDLFRVINTEYKSGAVEIWLNKPISYLVLKTGETLGKNIPVTVGLIGCSIIFWIINGLPEVNHLFLRLFWGTILLLFGVIMSYIMYSMIGLCTVWMEDSKPVFQIVDKTIMIFGGAYIPIGFFPPTFRLIGESLPTGAVTLLSQIFYPDFFQNLPRFILTQIGWIIILGAALWKMNNSATKKLVVNGG